MPLKAIYSECNAPMWLEVAAGLARELDWQPVYWIGVPSLRPLLAERWPQAVFHSKIEAIKGLPAPACAQLPPAPLDHEILASLAAVEGMTLRMLDRMDPRNSFSFRERLDLYYRYLGYWTAVLDRLEPQAAFFPIAPHMGYDYVLYELCKQRSIPTVMLEQVILTSRLYPTSRYEEQETVLNRAYRSLLARDQGGPVPLSPQIEEALAALARDYKPPFYVTRMLKKPANGPAERWLWAKGLPWLIKGKTERAWRILTTPAPPNYMKVKGRRFQDRPLSHLGFEYYRWLGRRRRARLRSEYEELASPPSLNEPFIYLPLHYQPEMSTMPTGGLYEDQRVVARLVSSCLPPGWRLYVKEHPFQVSSIGRGQQSRPQGYYQDLLALPGVSLMPLGYSSYELIDHAQVTVTITGQAAWEAVNRSKPAITFGSAWYRGCEGVFHTPDLEAFKQALNQIRAGYQVDRRKVRLFALAVEQTTTPGFAEGLFGKEYGLSEEDNVANITRLVSDHWRREFQDQS